LIDECVGNEVWQRHLATKSGDDFGRLRTMPFRAVDFAVSKPQAGGGPAVDLIGVGSTCTCDAACYHGIASSRRTTYGVADTESRYVMVSFTLGVNAMTQRSGGYSEYSGYTEGSSATWKGITRRHCSGMYVRAVSGPTGSCRAQSRKKGNINQSNLPP
jgi:hypothetical protein